MDTATFWLLVVLPWAAVGALVGITMGRRGHHLPAWLALGIAWGPFAIPLAWSAARHEQPGATRVLRPGRARDGGVDLLAAVDGSPESVTAMVRATTYLGDRLGRLVLLRVVDLDTAADDDDPDLAAAEAELRAIVERYVPDLDPRVVVMAGVPHQVISRVAHDEGFGLVSVGARGGGLSDHLLGSVADALTRRCPVPVLVVRDDVEPRPAPPRPGRTAAVRGGR